MSSLKSLIKSEIKKEMKKSSPKLSKVLFYKPLTADRMKSKILRAIVKSIFNSKK